MKRRKNANAEVEAGEEGRVDAGEDANAAVDAADEEEHAVVAPGEAFTSRAQKPLIDVLACADVHEADELKEVRGEGRGGRGRREG